MLGGGAATGRTNVSILGEGGTLEKPMLGRYQVEKELGKGAMGVVYLGKDPKIGRVVAIKTMALAQEFEADELAEVKERFFREAETAGRLSHPNIVTIYDAGEEHDLCYIAMELLKGGDLVSFSKPGTCCRLRRWSRSSRARRGARLRAQAGRRPPRHQAGEPDVSPGHRHAQGHRFRHRPAHRFVEDQDRHGARHASFMSPEQLAGKRIEGRSDLFSLAVSLYQLLSGRLPFEGESMAQLMFKISNEPPRTFAP
jgi:serine/threonine-protein kinase